MSTDVIASEQDKKQPGEKTPEQTKLNNDNNNNNNNNKQVKGEGQPLRDAILKQIEFYFSRQNLSKDAYLVSHMDHDMFVPVEVLANFKLVKTLTTDVDLILDVMKESQHVQVDASRRKIAPNMTVTRNTVILREIPSDSDEEEVKALLQSDECPKPRSIRSEVGDNWFITFNSESDALDAFFYLQQQKFNGKPVKVGMKSENVLRSTYPTNGEQVLDFKPFFIPTGAQWRKGMDGHGHGHGHGYEPFVKRGHNRHRGRGSRPRKDDRRGREHGPSNNHKDRSKGGKRKRRGDKGEKRPLPSNNSSDFPPLPSSRGKGNNNTVQTGYKEDFIKYSKQEIIDTISNIDKCQKPEDLPNNCIAVSSSPNTQLELTKPLPQSETLDTAVESSIGNPEHKSFAEAVLTAQDIKTPEGNRNKRSGKGRRNSMKEGARKDAKRKENNQNAKKDEQEDQKKKKHKKSRRRNSHKKKQYKVKKNPSGAATNDNERNRTQSGDESNTSYAAILKKQQEQKDAQEAAKKANQDSSTEPVQAAEPSQTTTSSQSVEEDNN